MMNSTSTCPLISIIIPVYKVEEYIEECIDSVIRQTFKNIEIILVDDGSPDRCPQICEDYARQDTRIKVIHKLNGGLSDARNVGMGAATGEYVVFLDSDDYWTSEHAAESFVKIINAYPAPDIIYFRRFAFGKNRGEIYRYPTFDAGQVNGCSKAEALEYLISNDRFIPSACNKLVRRELLKQTVFEKGLVCEDIDWNFALTLKARRFCVTNDLIYAYRIRPGSITQTIGRKNINDLLYILEKWSAFLSEEGSEEKIRKLLLSYCAYQFAIVLGLIYFIKDKPCRHEFVSRARKLSGLFHYDATGKVRKVKMLYRIFGLQLTGRLLAWYIKIKQ